MLTTRTASFPFPFYSVRSDFASPKSIVSQLDRLFADISNTASDRAASHTGPALQVWEDEHGYSVEAECPGLALNELELYVTGKQLSIAGKRENVHSDAGIYHRQERQCGEFKRVVTFPAAVNADAVDATLKDGILTIHIAKEQAVRPRKIEVKSSE